MKNLTPLFGLLVVGLILTIGVIMFGSALEAVDYEASNNTGNMTATTNQTMTMYKINYAWWGGAALLIFIIVIGIAFWTFFK